MSDTSVVTGQDPKVNPANSATAPESKGPETVNTVVTGEVLVAPSTPSTPPVPANPTGDLVKETAVSPKFEQDTTKLDPHLRAMKETPDHTDYTAKRNPRNTAVGQDPNAIPLNENRIEVGKTLQTNLRNMTAAGTDELVDDTEAFEDKVNEGKTDVKAKDLVGAKK